ncbi:MAG: tyrosine--tRNA ligase [Polyangiaceae bacterium]|nr:tyrosine--tRNA ligase [Polyangiaceae bacterium]MCE7891324.1 tyrosine--tRNA ligase [Sorangiineae bacterium PRO1]MCL4750708.1 tyrosine--tRNA ligase [Myxococcales bacterium]
MPTAEEQFTELSRGVVDLVQRDELLDRLRAGRPLKIKAGFDPTRPDLHLGHTVLLQKMRQFQDFGHEVTFLIGDFTAMVGDPTGQNEMRPRLTREAVLAAAKTYQEQAFKVLDADKTVVRYNSEWLGAMSLDKVVELAAKRTVARTLERRDFRERLEQHKDIYLHELLYPLLQGYDSVALQSDVELGGTDQLFNLMVGRDLMQRYGQKPQIVLTTPILEGIDAKIEDGQIVGKKMSKSADNYVGLTEAPVDMFRKCMQIDDQVVWRFFELLSSRTSADIAELRAKADPIGTKAAFASEMVSRFHGADAAESAGITFRATYLGDGVPAEVPEAEVPAEGGKLLLAKALAHAKLVSSNGEGRRMIQGGGVEVDGAVVKDALFELRPGGQYLVRVGSKNRRFCRIRVAP